LQGGVTCACDYEAGIVSLALPGVKNTPQSTKIAVNDGTISVIVTKHIIGKEDCHHPRRQDSQPLPKTPPDEGQCGRVVRPTLNSLTPKSVLAGMENSRSEDFWLAKHKDTNIPTMMEPFSPPAAWF